MFRYSNIPGTDFPYLRHCLTYLSTQKFCSLYVKHHQKYLGKRDIFFAYNPSPDKVSDLNHPVYGL